VRLLLVCAAALWACACGTASPPGPAPASAPPGASSSAATRPVDPARIDRSRTALPPGYEVAAATADATPAMFWGYGPGWTADPAPCGVLADPAAGAPTRGWSASGPGGIVSAIVAAAGADIPVGCDRWTLRSGHTSGTVTLAAGPDIAGARTVTLRTDSTTTVEGGTQTGSHADTASAYLDGQVVVVSVVTDPGSPNPALGQGFAAELLAETVAALRG
jgi:hypothetical protein